VALRNISLRDFVIVRELDLDLADGFTVLTGETGAGKSILIDALQLALGARADAGVVRENASRCEVCAQFTPPPSAQAWLDRAGFEAGEILLLKRTVDSLGKSRAWINGSPATATQLRELGELLLDIHGQHAWQSLTRPDAVRDLLDAYAHIDCSLVKNLWMQWRSSQQAHELARGAQDNLVRERERLNWQIGELEKLSPGTDEWANLNTEHTRLSNAQALMDGAQFALNSLESEDSAGALRSLSRAVHALQEQTHVEPEFQTLSDVLLSSLAQAEDAAHSLHAYLRKTDLDPQRLAQLDERMGLWISLSRRYKRQPEDLAALLQGWRTELTALDAASDLEKLAAAEKAALKDCLLEARKITQLRTRAAPQLALSVTQAMQQLGMQGGRFEVGLETHLQPSMHGLEEVAFLVAGHAGTTPKPVGKVASGGELSRIALAIAVSTSELGEAGTLIFDEVDAGVGGAVAETVGRLMNALGQHRQVLAVTHLPQVAACADHHLLVAKATLADGVASQVAPLSTDQRVLEVARMLGGEKLSATTMAHAREMLGHNPTQGIESAPPKGK